MFKGKKSLPDSPQESIHLKVFMKGWGVGIKKSHMDLLSEPEDY